MSDENAEIADWLLRITHDQLEDGREIRLLNIFDGFNREGLAMMA
jgi:hypothetical protein